MSCDKVFTPKYINKAKIWMYYFMKNSFMQDDKPIELSFADNSTFDSVLAPLGTIGGIYKPSHLNNVGLFLEFASACAELQDNFV